MSAPIGGPTSSRRARRKVDRLTWHLALAVALLVLLHETGHVVEADFGLTALLQQQLLAEALAR